MNRNRVQQPLRVLIEILQLKSSQRLKVLALRNRDLTSNATSIPSHPGWLQVGDRISASITAPHRVWFKCDNVFRRPHPAWYTKKSQVLASRSYSFIQIITQSLSLSKSNLWKTNRMSMIKWWQFFFLMFLFLNTF